MNLSRLMALAGGHVALLEVIRKIQAQPEDSNVQYKRVVVAVLRYLQSPRPVEEVAQLTGFLHQVLTTCPMNGDIEVPEAKSVEPAIQADAPDGMVIVAETETPTPVKSPKRKKR